MMGNKDCREELYQELSLLLLEQGCMAEIKDRLYILLSAYEITLRTTEIALLEEDRNEYLLKKFIVAKMVKGCTQRTVGYYQKELTGILQQIGKTVDDICADDIRLYLAKRMAVDKVTKVTADNELRCLRTFFQYLITEELVKKNPVARVDRIKAEKTHKEAFTEFEIEQLRDAAADEREAAILELLLSTGCRVSELVGIKREDIDYVQKQILVHGKGEKDRYVYLNARALMAVNKYMKLRKDDNPYLFASSVDGFIYEKGKGKGYSWWKFPQYVHKERHLDRESPSNITNTLGKRAGLTVKCNAHKFRRTCATLALRRGMPIEQVSMMLGHEQIATTQIYLDIGRDELKYAHGKFVV